MDADLVRASGSRIRLDERMASIALEHAVVGDRLAPGSIHADHLLLGMGVALSQPPIDAAFPRGRLAPADRDVALRDRPCLELARQGAMSEIVLRHDHHPGCLLVE